MGDAAHSHAEHEVGLLGRLPRGDDGWPGVQASLCLERDWDGSSWEEGLSLLWHPLEPQRSQTRSSAGHVAVATGLVQFLFLI